MRRSDTIRISRFYIRRGLRLIPCLAAVLIASAVAKVVAPASIAWSDLFYAGTYTMNWARAFGATGGGFLGHTWSLSIEEQFYLLWPLTILCVARFPRKAVALFLFASVAVTIYRIAAFHTFGPVRTYNGLDTHADPLLIGSALAFANFSAHPLPYPWRNLLSFVAFGFVLIVSPMFFWQDARVQMVGFSLVSISTCVLIADCMCPGPSVLRSVLEVRLLVWIGQISYGLYLWHYLIYGGIKNVDIIWGWRVAIVGIPLSLFAAALSYYWLELPFLKMKDRFAGAVRPTEGQDESPCGLHLSDIEMATK